MSDPSHLTGSTPVRVDRPWRASARGAVAMSANLTLFVDDHCPACGGAIERAPTGRPATYCSATCRLRAHRRETKPEVAAMATTIVSPAEPASSPALAAIAAGITTPVDAYGPVRAYCEVRDGGYGVVFGRDGGRVDEPAGPVFRRPRQAIELAAGLNARLADLNLIPNMKMAAASTRVSAAAGSEVRDDFATPTAAV